MGGGKKRPTGKIDVAIIQSLIRNHDVDGRVMNYGHLIVDECHHGSAVSFEAVIKRARGRYILGLSATVARKDGHQPVVFMQYGPVRHRVTDAHNSLRPAAFTAPRCTKPGLPVLN
jgi:superfamily II DNA or RNA helicase